MATDHTMTCPVCGTTACGYASYSEPRVGAKWGVVVVVEGQEHVLRVERGKRFYKVTAVELVSRPTVKARTQKEAVETLRGTMVHFEKVGQRLKLTLGARLERVRDDSQI